MQVITYLFLLFGFIYVGIPVAYIFWMKRVASLHPWNIKVDSTYKPRLDIILPTYNESDMIISKLQNLSSLNYPKDLMQVIVVDSDSTDGTAELEENFAKENPNFKMLVLQEAKRTGKSGALNLGLSRCKGEIVVTTDAGDQWDPNVLNLLAQYLADPTVGAVAGVEQILNSQQSSATQSEVAYRKLHDYIRIGESKIHSTLILHGGLTAYRRSAFDRFDDKRSGNDEAVSIELVSKGLRCILLPEAISRYNDYHSWSGKVSRKITRAWALIYIWTRCMKLAFQGKFKLPKSVFISNIYIYLINPIIGLFFYTFAIITMIQYPVLFIPLAVLLLVKPTRTYFIAFITHNLYIIIGFFDHARRTKKHIVWRKVKEPADSLEKTPLVMKPIISAWECTA